MKLKASHPSVTITLFDALVTDSITIGVFAQVVTRLKTFTGDEKVFGSELLIL
jgi:hypothetical protein